MGVPFSTYLLDNTLKMKRLEREKSRKKRIAEVFKALGKMAEEIDFEDAFIFGSLAKKGSYSEEADVDIGFIGLADSDFFRAQSFLFRALGTDVDIIQIEKSEKLKDKIVKQGLRWTKQG